MEAVEAEMRRFDLVEAHKRFEEHLSATAKHNFLLHQ